MLNGIACRITKKPLVFFIVILYKKRAMKKLPAKKRGASKNLDRNIIVGIVIAIAIIGLVLWGPLRGRQPAEEKKTSVVQKHEAKREEPKKTEKSIPKKSVERPLAAPLKTVLVAVVIDDLGQDLKQAQDLLSIRSRITVAVLPGLAQSKKIAELARNSNHEVLLHLPMEYRGKNGKPAPGMLRSDMTPMEYLNIISNDVASVPGAVGVNNHEGSLLTENKEAMKFLMAELKARNVFFLDSLTSSKSVAYATAKEFGLKAAKRDVFLDNEPENPAYIKKQLDELADTAKKHGKAIGIGHPHPVTIKELRAWIPRVAAEGIEIVPVSRLIQ